jgi:hypothetical protein
MYSHKWQIFNGQPWRKGKMEEVKLAVLHLGPLAEDQSKSLMLPIIIGFIEKGLNYKCQLLMVVKLIIEFILILNFKFLKKY